jgi:hypothetical protein
VAEKSEEMGGMGRRGFWRDAGATFLALLCFLAAISCLSRNRAGLKQLPYLRQDLPQHWFRHGADTLYD